MCSLCAAIPEQVFGSFYLLTCRSCGVPMLVCREHRDWITAEEFQEFVTIARRHFPGYSLRGVGMRTVPAHWHEHLCPPGHGCPI
jgi:hypothetical protein